ncbi:Patatin OS=Tsukamurella paurometabola (strain ATCC 8368 / DSM / CCUG 35730 / CIP 100753 / JCM 10117 / KCTC 9821 / NBRC 16120 / NCIMB 702349 / NCTC 13040)OX=521096 GN=Tpau_2443 PE=4 SV=1 [Tsukamurella paurometabola]|uniref:Patatin n=1 Tax=Tsukamurella paurometabola (strain ATCC 8368 / DSM 20162 / CCUG 35730 / CIP 100753 / JCM 10117 / KCTC 9821 / NBRC 16120 / NCIMB 702349 / NCTC 13040) TaxID=521096 RepID=D5UR59_TSUPD|nr:patatin-like phospholipase family protein [Tsukamurella paurometabola]ADG79048.1 Patatin [Tsukamurella paurometabola DSM 20162]SUP33889.1 Uncharacterised protein [Tsukamurella paurometabola]
MHTTEISCPSRRRRALVLGGGGSAGNAWLIGVVAGLREAALDVTEADLIVGTSAGATAAVQITTADPAHLLADILAAPSPGTPGAARASSDMVAEQMRRTAEIIDSAGDLADMRRRMGAFALSRPASSDAGAQQRWRATVASRLPTTDWPVQAVTLTAVDAVSGVPVMFDRNSGVAVADAVAASCSSGFALRIGDGWFIDGGYRSNADNADVAAGYERVLVLSPFGGATRTPANWRAGLAAQAAELRAAGTTVEIVRPDSAARAAFGDNMMDLSARAPAARAGAAQGRDLAAQLRAFWS